MLTRPGKINQYFWIINTTFTKHLWLDFQSIIMNIRHRVISNKKQLVNGWILKKKFISIMAWMKFVLNLVPSKISYIPEERKLDLYNNIEEKWIKNEFVRHKVNCSYERT